MEKIKIITDSACDMSREDEIKYGIDIMCFPITIGNESFYDRDITPQEYYKKMDEHEEMPVHSQLNVVQFGEKYMEYAALGYTDIFFVSINSYGSATYSNSVLAKEELYEKHPEDDVKQQCEKAVLKYLIMLERECLAERQQIRIIRGGKR